MGGMWQQLLLLLPACIQGSAGAPAVQQTGVRGALNIPLHRITAIKVTRPVSMELYFFLVHLAAIVLAATVLAATSSDGEVYSSIQTLHLLDSHPLFSETTLLTFSPKNKDRKGG